MALKCYVKMTSSVSSSNLNVSNDVSYHDTLQELNVTFDLNQYPTSSFHNYVSHSLLNFIFVRKS